MFCTGLFRIIRAGALLGAILVVDTSAAVAQTPGQTQNALFARILNNPTDRTLMMEYARAASAARDFEAAISTLERLLDIDPAHQEARFDLARTYAALGANGPARYHMDIYLRRADLTGDDRTQAETRIQTSRRQEQDITLRGAVQLGLAHRSRDGSTGLAFGGNVVVQQDLGGAITHRWDTEVSLRGFYLRDDPEGSRSRIILRSGPSFAIDGTALGPRLRPFLGIEHVRNGDLADEGTAATLGLSYDHPVSREFGVFASVEAGHLWREDASDANRLRGLIGATWRPTPDLDLRLSARRTTETTDVETLARNSVRLDVSWRFEPGFGTATTPWVLAGFGQADTEEFSGGRKDDLSSYGVRLRAFWTDPVFTEVNLSRLTRNSSANGFDTDENILTVTVGRRF